MADITIGVSLTATVDGLTVGQNKSITPTLTAPETLYGDIVDASATALEAVPVGAEIDYTDISFIQLSNLSETEGENIYILKKPRIHAGGVDEGTVAAASLPSTLSDAGDYKEITTAGTGQGKTWALGDIAVYLGTSAAYLQLKSAVVAIIKPGETVAIRAAGDGISYYSLAATGTPRMQIAAFGPAEIV